MDKNLKYYFLVVLLAFIAGGIIGFFVGRTTFNIKEKTEYEKGEQIIGTVLDNDIELVVETTQDIIVKTDTIIEYRDGELKKVIDTIFITQTVDTASIVADYQQKRIYKSLLFDNDKQGKMLVFPTIFQNRLVSIDYDFTPIHKNTYIYKEKVWQPFVSASYSTLDYLGVGGGAFYHNLGFEYQYNIDIRSKPMILQPVDKYFERGNYHWFSGKYKF